MDVGLDRCASPDVNPFVVLPKHSSFLAILVRCTDRLLTAFMSDADMRRCVHPRIPRAVLDEPAHVVVVVVAAVFPSHILLARCSSRSCAKARLATRTLVVGALRAGVKPAPPSTVCCAGGSVKLPAWCIAWSLEPLDRAKAVSCVML